jgi:hypothetical protein
MLTTNHPVLVSKLAAGQNCSGGLLGDPSMTLVPPSGQYLTHYTTYCPPGYTLQFIDVIVPDYALGTVYQDGVLIPTAIFISMAGSNYSSMLKNKYYFIFFNVLLEC